LKETKDQIISLKSDLEKANTINEVNEKKIFNLTKEIESLKKDIGVGKEQSYRLYEENENLKNELNKQLDKVSKCILIPKENQIVSELEEAYNELKNMIVDISTLKVVNPRLTIMKSKFNDLRENWTSELGKIRAYFGSRQLEESNDGEIIQNCLRIIVLLQNLRRLTELETIRKSKEEKAKIEFFELKKMMEGKNFN
jgi:hypothetical protein